MDLQNTCRLCLSKEGEFYKLFDASNGKTTLAEELNRLLDFKMENNNDLPDSICGNCYNINSFFKEFRRDCNRVKNKLQLLVALGKTEVSVKLESEDNDNNSNEEGTSKKSSTDNLQNMLLGSYVETLRSNFQDAIESGVDNVTKDGASQSETKCKKRPNENSENTEVNQDKATVQEPLLALVKSEYISDEEETFEQASDSENSNQFNAVNDSSSLGLKGASRNEECSSPKRKRQRVMLEGKESIGFEGERSSITLEDIHHKVKEEEIEIFDPPEEDDLDDNSDGEDSYEKEGFSSDPLDGRYSSDADEISSVSNLSSDDSDEDTDLLLCLALLL